MKRIAVIVNPGDKYGHLTVVQEIDKHKISSGRAYRAIECLCDCGKKHTTLLQSLRSGHTQSCGCLQVEVTRKRTTKHGHTPAGNKTRMYRIWTNMIQRCHNPNYTYYERYGARGVTVCDRWRENFEAFFEDMGEPPTEKHTLDRKNNDLGYSLNNCRWATRKQQQRNMSSNRMIEHKGESLCLQEWSDRYCLTASVLSYRLKKGWSMEQSLTTPIKSRSTNTNPLSKQPVK